MGYCYDQNHRLCCDICGNSGGVRKMPCPVNWCQPVAACPTCRKAKRHVPEDKHAHCRERQTENARKLAEFRAGSLHLTLVSDEDGALRVSTDAAGTDWYFTACDHFNRTWFPVDVQPAFFAELKRLGHTFEVER